jgi:Putative DNA-binding domain
VGVPTGNRSELDETLALIEAEARVWVRIGASLQEDGKWYARLVELTSGAPPPGWKAREWLYPQVIFVASVLTGKAVAKWLRSAQARVAGRKVVFPAVRGQASWQRQQSHAPSSFERLDWPVTETTLAHVENRSEPSDHLISNSGAPSFVRFHNAAALFFCLGEVRGGSLSQTLTYRHQDRFGRIESVKVGQDEVRVLVEGPGIGGLIVEFASDAAGPTYQIPEAAGPTDTAVFRLEGSLPSGAWVLLRRGSSWVDIRFLAGPWRRNTDDGVEFIEARTRLEVLVADREGQGVEFKALLPDDPFSVMKTVCAFANGEGGSILIGVGDEDGIPGVEDAEIDSLKDRLTQLVGTWIDPTPTIQFSVLPTDLPRKSVLEMRVEPGGRLLGSKTNRRSADFVPYIRRNAITVRARMHEIETIARSRQGSVAGKRPVRLTPAIRSRARAYLD